MNFMIAVFSAVLSRTFGSGMTETSKFERSRAPLPPYVMVLPVGSVLRLYEPVFCRATPHEESAPVQEVSEVGLAFWASGSGCDVLMIQSALPAVSALLLSNSTRWTTAADAGGVETTVTRMAPAATVAAASSARVRTSTMHLRVGYRRKSMSRPATRGPYWRSRR